MTYTRRQYVLMSVLAAGLAALVVDVLFLRDGDLPPQKAQAETAGDAEKLVPAAPQASADAPRYALARKVRDLAAAQPAASEAAGDPFQPSDDWMAELRKKPVELDPGQAIAQGFLERHRLSSVLCLPTQSTAIVDQQILKVGDGLDGFRLISIKPTSVIFSHGSINVVLNINQAASAKEQ